jgi:hypothetical protein
VSRRGESDRSVRRIGRLTPHRGSDEGANGSQSGWPAPPPPPPPPSSIRCARSSAVVHVDWGDGRDSGWGGGGASRRPGGAGEACLRRSSSPPDQGGVAGGVPSTRSACGIPSPRTPSPRARRWASADERRSHRSRTCRSLVCTDRHDCTGTARVGTSIPGPPLRQRCESSRQARICHRKIGAGRRGTGRTEAAERSREVRRTPSCCQLARCGRPATCRTRCNPSIRESRAVISLSGMHAIPTRGSARERVERINGAVLMNRGSPRLSMGLDGASAEMRTIIAAALRAYRDRGAGGGRRAYPQSPLRMRGTVAA